MELVECACGCGTLIKKRKGIEVQFVRGHYWTGKKRPKETGEKISASNSAYKKYPILKNREWLYQKYWNEEASFRDICSIVGCSASTIYRAFKEHGIESRGTGTGGKHTEAAKKKMSDSIKRLWKGDEYLAKMKASHQNYSEEYRQKKRETTKKLWKDEAYIKNVLSGINRKPTKPERKLDEILQKYFPNEWRYNGDFSMGITIGGKIPDFVNVNGKKQVIEVFSVYHDEKFLRKHFKEEIAWHRTEFGTLATYSQCGFECIIFWERKLNQKNAEDYVLSALTSQ